jgi:hypothetical protein
MPSPPLAWFNEWFKTEPAFEIADEESAPVKADSAVA